MEPLDGMLQSGSIALLQDVAADFNDEVRSNTQEEVAERRMTQATQGEPVRYNGFSLGLRIGDDVGGVKQLTFAAAGKKRIGYDRHGAPAAETSVGEGGLSPGT